MEREITFALLEYGILGALVIVLGIAIFILWRSDRKAFRDIFKSHSEERKQWWKIHTETAKELSDTGMKQVDAINNLANRIEFLTGRVGSYSEPPPPKRHNGEA